ncbi:DUF2975 domain-containing protein [Ferruginibacter sp. HRS2-29]|uniref:DUF2975 domain-containing protein n=1 Tax=Ferruginibacter sp. HRS2-29 TaxID=2487334 RepID=UPI0020CDFDA3|nr:DUF2975 domain-containing protein [Ferruginibacter sp. HRS2-29]MCP9751456.1 DUF2975 domain-containing protein [Ferruginibacter sp. HRS2-29]
MKTTNKGILIFLHIIAWIIFIGVSINAGAVIVSFVAGLVGGMEAAKRMYLQLDFSSLYYFSKSHYISLMSVMVIVTILKATIFYLVIRIFMKINLVQPFSIEVSKLISGIAWLALGTGLFTVCGNHFCDWLQGAQGVSLPDLREFLGGGEEFLLLGGAIFMIAQVFKRGIEIQSENELTV